MNGLTGPMEMGYANQLVEKQACDVQDRNRTVLDNIDSKISMMKAEIARLEESKKTLEPLLAMRIRDIRDAMNF